MSWARPGFKQNRRACFLGREKRVGGSEKVGNGKGDVSWSWGWLRLERIPNSPDQPEHPNWDQTSPQLGVSSPEGKPSGGANSSPAFPSPPAPLKSWQCPRCVPTAAPPWGSGCVVWAQPGPHLWAKHTELQSFLFFLPFSSRFTSNQQTPVTVLSPSSDANFFHLAESGLQKYK